MELNKQKQRTMETKKGTEKFSLVGADTCRKAIADNPNYRLHVRCGYAYRGARENLVNPKNTPRLERFYDWGAAFDVDIDHDKKEIHLNGFSYLDLE